MFSNSNVPALPRNSSVTPVRCSPPDSGRSTEEALAAFRNTRNESGYSPNQFFLMNWRDPNLPHLLSEPVVEEMVEARDRVRQDCIKYFLSCILIFAGP